MNTTIETKQIFIPQKLAKEAFSNAHQRHEKIAQALVEWFANKTFPMPNSFLELRLLVIQQVTMALICENVERSHCLKRIVIKQCTEIAYNLFMKAYSNENKELTPKLCSPVENEIKE